MTGADGPSGEVRVLLAALDQAYDHRSWHGTNLRGSLRGLSSGEAAWRPARDRHNIWEIAVHAAYWKYAVWRRLSGAPRGSFPLEGSNWFPRPIEATAKAWRDDLALLSRMHAALRRAVAETPPARLRAAVRGEVGALALVTGIIAHDLYHAGQIQLIKTLHRRR